MPISEAQFESAPAAVPAVGQVDPAIESLDLQLDGHRLHLLAAGPVSASRSVLLLHGGRFDSEAWRKLGTVGLLGERGLRTVAIDLPGFGRSEPSERAEGELLAALLSVLEHEVGLVRPVVVAPSMSGRVVLSFLAASSKDARGGPIGGASSPPLTSSIAGLVALAPVGIPRFEGALASLQLPTLIVWGSEDRVVPVAHAERMHDLVAGSRLVILEGAGHASYLEQPEAFHAALFAFLDEAATGETR